MDSLQDSLAFAVRSVVEVKAEHERRALNKRQRREVGKKGGRKRKREEKKETCAS
jgi:hypothetical protein